MSNFATDYTINGAHSFILNITGLKLASRAGSTRRKICGVMRGAHATFFVAGGTRPTKLSVCRLCVSDGEPFVGDLKGFDCDFVGVRFEIGAGDFGGPCVGQGPHHGWLALFVEQVDGHGGALDGVHFDLVEPVAKFVVIGEHAFFHGDVAEFLDAGHFDYRKLLAVAVPVFDRLCFDVETGDFLE